MVGLSSLLLLCIFWLRKKKISYFKIIFFSSVILYLIPILAFQYESYKIKQEMKKYDINNDGFFSKEEMTYELEELENNLINDSGFGIFVFFGYPFCLLYTIMITLIFHVTTKFIKPKLLTF
ncbi:hypothetical protein GFJ94_11645 [Flavobacterium sp. LMO8]|nr:hypothetical protein [Flavobacterium sp. LMO8]